MDPQEPEDTCTRDEVKACKARSIPFCEEGDDTQKQLDSKTFDKYDCCRVQRCKVRYADEVLEIMVRGVDSARMGMSLATEVRFSSLSHARLRWPVWVLLLR